MTSTVQDLISFQNRVTYESFIKRWAAVYVLPLPLTQSIGSYPIFTHIVRNRRFLWSYLWAKCVLVTTREETDEFDIANHVFCVDEPITMEEVLQYSQQQALVVSPHRSHP